MIKGEFDIQGRPAVRATLRVFATSPQINIAFLIDTGAVDTIVMPNDAARLGPGIANLPQLQPIIGLGSSHIRGYPVSNAEAFFIGDDGTLYKYYVDVLIVLPSAPRLTYPSLLGLGILSR